MQFIRVALNNKKLFSGIILSAFILLALFLVQCSRQNGNSKYHVVVGIPADVSTFNPLFAFDVQEGNIIDLLYLKLFNEKWNDSLGVIEFEPMLAENYTVSRDSNYITIILRDNLKWSDGQPLTADDIVFSFDVYSDPKVNSRLYGLFNNFFSLDDLHIDSQKSFKKNSDKSLTIYFKSYTDFTLLDLNFAVLPSHIFNKYSREELQTAAANFNPVTSGPYKLLKWNRDQNIQLAADSTCYLFSNDMIQNIVFKIIPDEYSMINQLKNGEIDIIEDLKSEKVKDLKDASNVSLGSIKGRNYDYIGWNNLDQVEFAKKQIKPNKFFGSPKVRKALSLAINRNELFASIIGKYGMIYTSPISPLFKSYYDSSLSSAGYNPDMAKKILAEEGWIDNDGDGLLEKGNLKFKFKLFTNTGNSVRQYSATVIKNNLRAIGVEAEVIFVEKNELIDGLVNKKYDAFLSGWTVPIPDNLDNFQNPLSENGVINFSGYYNPEVDALLKEIKPSTSQSRKNEIFKKVNQILSEDEPVTLLFWDDNIVAFNKRIENISFAPIGLFMNTREWRIRE